MRGEEQAREQAAGRREPRGLIVDWGGVLTADLHQAFGDWSRRDGVDPQHFADVLRSWLGPRPDGASVDAAARGGRPGGGAPGVTEAETEAETEASGRDVLARVTDHLGADPVSALERGELPVADFERLLAGELAARGSTVRAQGLVERVLHGLQEQAPDMLGLVRRARRAGLRTALLSNSWGNSYPRQEWDALFDAVVISGEVGMRKPEARIYAHTADRLGLAPHECVMVDDLVPNVLAAVEVGMVGVLHRSYAETRAELEAVFDLQLG